VQKVQLEPLNLDLLKISNKVRFILNVGHGDITVIDRELDDLVLELQSKGFAPFPETSKKPEGVRSISARDYEYLLSIPISSMTREKVHELYAETSKLEEKIKEVRGATPRLLWMKDLDALEAELDVSLVIPLCSFVIFGECTGASIFVCF
jgi:DNA topoisomerase-2